MMRLIKRDTVYNTLDKEHIPAATIKSGETVRIETQLQSGTWLNSLDDRWDPSKSRGPNLCTVVGVEGAEPGDTLAVEILNIIPEKLGYTGFAGWRTPLAGRILPEAKEWGTVTHTVEITETGVLWSPEITIPLKPMIGTIATAPAGNPQTNRYAYHNGGNMDVQEICAGTTLYLPVEVSGALLHVGDCHAVMGDGEINHGGAIECAAEVTLRPSVIKGYAAKEWLRAENKEYIMTIANETRIKDSFCGAVRELIRWMCEDYGFAAQEAYLLLGQVLEARCTMLHGDDAPFSPYVAKIRKEYLRAYRAFDWSGQEGQFA